MSKVKKKLLRWAGWFFLGNAFLFWLIELKNLPLVISSEYPMLTVSGKVIESVFLFFLYFGYLSLLAFLPCLVVLLLVYLIPNRRFIYFVSIVLAVMAASALIIDVTIYGLYRFHLNGIILQLASSDLSGQIFGFSKWEYITAILVLFSVCGIEILYAYWAWRFLNKCKGYGKGAAIFLGICFYISYSMIFFSNNQLMNRIFIDSTHFLPFYNQAISISLFNENGVIGIERVGERNFWQPQQASGALNYPLQKNFQCNKQKSLNLIIIVIDAWRFDMLNSSVMPSLTAFTKNADVFTHHFSGGNATGPGVFSLFYGLPSMYWTAMETQHQGPLLIETLIKQNYQIGIFSSATLTLPAFDKTIFQRIKNIREHTPGKTAYDRDVVITNEFKIFLTQAKKNSQPIFSFLFYDAAHSYCQYDNDLKPFAPVIKNCDRFNFGGVFDREAYLNRYKNALLLTDKQISDVINTLKANNMLDNTVVVITGDHGEEFNDNQLGYLGHTSNYTRFQVQTPLIIHWPKGKSHVFSHLTTHYDIAPTLLKRALGCGALASSYSLGKDLFDRADPAYVIVNSYIGLGVVEPERITTIFQVGNFEIQNLNAKPILNANLHIKIMQSVFSDLKRFYK